MLLADGGARLHSRAARAHMQPALKSRQRSRSAELEVVRERTSQLLNAALEQIIIARDLRETTVNLRQTNKDYREYLRENCLRGLNLAQP